LRSQGFQAWLVGGCVRDLLLGREPKDYDISTDARPEELLGLFPRAHLVGAQFGVVLVDGVEIATFRSDHSYADGRHPGRVVFETDPKQDVLRRDFTINALLLDPSVLNSSYSPSSLYSQVVDYVGGLVRSCARRHPRHRRSGAALRRRSSADAAGRAFRGALRLRNRARDLGRHPEAARSRFCGFRPSGFATSWFGS
jgi:hypothetical protein